MPYADVNGQRLYYEDSGGDGPVVVFSHGFMMDREMFAPQVQALAGEFRCLTWDQRGFGLTGGIPARYDFWDSARDCLGLLASLGIERATLVGMSQGGFLSMRAALLAPERVRVLVLIDTRPDLDDEETKANFAGLRQEWLANGPTNAGPGLAAFLLGAAYDAAPWLAKWAQMPKEALAAPIDAIVERDDITPRLTEITGPALVIHGEADSAIPIAHGEALCQALPACQGLVRVPGAAHAPNLTHPEGVNGPLREFLRQSTGEQASLGSGGR